MSSIKTIMLIGVALLFVSVKPDHFKRRLPVGDDITIKIHGPGTVFLRGDFSIEIHKTRSQIKITYSLLDSVRISGWRADTEATRIGVEHHKLEIAEHCRSLPFPPRFDEILEKYKVFSRDTLYLDAKKYASYSDLLDRVAAASNDLLENKEKNKSRILLDGTWTTYEISTRAGNRAVSVDSPDGNSHPLLYQLITNTMDIYRKNGRPGHRLRGSFGGH